MKRIFGITMLFIIIYTVPTFASNRVIHKFEHIGQYSGRIQLQWLNVNPSPIQITAIKKVNDQTIQVSYRTGTGVPKYDAMSIMMEDVLFPPIIILQEEAGTKKTFTDLPKEEQYVQAIGHLYDLGVVNGYPDGTYKPTQPVSRQEFTTMVVKGASIPLLKNQTSTFTDVKNDLWSKDYIMTLTARGIIQGKAPQKFAPQDTITLGEVAALLNRTFTFLEYKQSKYASITKEHWSNIHVKRLVDAGIIRDTDSFYKNYDPNQKATRADCALLFSRVLTTLRQPQ